MGVLDLLFPKTCLGCGKEGLYVCSGCLAKVRLVKPVCPYCEKASIDGFTHTKCAKKYGLDGLICPWEYEGVVRKAILALKYKHATEIVMELQRYTVTELKSKLVPSNYCLVPVPLHWYRQNTRGFNQSIEIGKAVAEQMGWKFTPDLLVKKVSTKSQAGLSVKDRKQNLHGVFSVSPYIDISLYPNILLFDDVFTTGSTLKEAAKALKRAGVAKVWGLTIAR